MATKRHKTNKNAFCDFCAFLWLFPNHPQGGTHVHKNFHCRFDAGISVGDTIVGSSRVRQRIRSKPAGAVEGEGGKSRMGQSTYLDPYRSDESRWDQEHLDD